MDVPKLLAQIGETLARMEDSKVSDLTQKVSELETENANLTAAIPVPLTPEQERESQLVKQNEDERKINAAVKERLAPKVELAVEAVTKERDKAIKERDAALKSNGEFEETIKGLRKQLEDQAPDVQFAKEVRAAGPQSTVRKVW